MFDTNDKPDDKNEGELDDENERELFDNYDQQVDNEKDQSLPLKFHEVSEYQLFLFGKNINILSYLS